MLDPARALALYDRIARELPDARVAASAERRAEHLRSQIGDGSHAGQARELAQLIAGADMLPPQDVVRRATALANAEWPGAADAALWLADWSRRSGRIADAAARYIDVATRWPHTKQASEAALGAAGCALDAGDWEHAEQLAMTLPNTTPSDQLVRTDMIAAAARGRQRDRLYRDAFLALAAAIAALLASLADAALRGGRTGISFRPATEVLFLAPVSGVLVLLAFTAHRAIAPAVARISVVGVVLAYLSGVALDTARARGRATRLRGLGHLVACAVGVAAIGYIAVMRDGLLDMVLETVQFGPEG